MIEIIHFVLGARPRKDRLVLLSFDDDDYGDDKRPVVVTRSPFPLPFLKPLFRVFEAIAQGMVGTMMWCTGAVEDVARFVFILFGVIPWLACMFVVLGVTFHIPRIFLTYACRPIMRFCWRHVSTCRKSPVASSKCCSGGCCSVCWLAVWMSGGTFPGSGVVACCSCGGRVRLS